MRGRCRFALLGAVLLLTGCKLGAYAEKELDEEAPLARWTAVSPRGARAWRATLDRRCGGVCKVRRLTVYLRSVSVEVQPRGRPNELDEVDVWDGDDVKSERPLNLRDDERRELSRELFELTPSLVERLPGLVRMSVERAGVERPVLRSVVLDRRRGVVEVMVRVEGARASRSLRWDGGTGQLLGTSE